MKARSHMWYWFLQFSWLWVVIASKCHSLFSAWKQISISHAKISEISWATCFFERFIAQPQTTFLQLSEPVMSRHLLVIVPKKPQKNWLIMSDFLLSFYLVVLLICIFSFIIRLIKKLLYSSWQMKGDFNVPKNASFGCFIQMLLRIKVFW